MPPMEDRGRWSVHTSEGRETNGNVPQSCSTIRHVR